MYRKFPMKNLYLKDVNPLFCGRRSCAPGFTVGPKMRDHYTLHYVLRGKGVFYTGGNTYSLESGSLFVIRPWEKYEYSADLEEPWEYIWVGFDCAESFSTMLGMDVLSLPEAEPLFLTMAEKETQGVREWEVCAQLYRLFALLGAMRLPAGMQSQDYISRALNYIQSNYSQSIQVAELAADLGLSRNYFCRLFHQHVGMSPQTYIVSYRLERAAAFMLERKLSQKEAALQVGYPDVCAFSRMFKRKYGVAPGAYVAARQEAERENP